MNKAPKTPRVKAMDFLARRDHSELELREKLQRHFSLEEIDPVIVDMKERGWILPPQELSDKVAEQLNRKNKGYLYICQFLRKKGLPDVPKNLDIELEKAMSLIESKGSEFLHKPNKLASLLKNRGFDTEIIGRVIHEIRRNSSSLY